MRKRTLILLLVILLALALTADLFAESVTAAADWFKVWIDPGLGASVKCTTGRTISYMDIPSNTVYVYCGR